jgi:radical SAM superfamily enzyme YgiQ (UPF0313 family)
MFTKRKRIIKALIEYNPDIVCFSVITDNYQWACEWAKEVKTVTKAKVIFGGIHPTSVPEKVISQEFVDYVCVGEGEYALQELVNEIDNGRDGKYVRNIWVKDGGRVIRNETRPLISDLDQLPLPDKALFHAAAPIFNGGYSIMTSRGCSNACKYCCNNVYRQIYGKEGGCVRRRSVENVMHELIKAKESFSPKHILFVDDIFNSDKKWLDLFLNEYEQKIRIPFACYLFPDNVDERLSAGLKKAGCFKVQMGVQVIDEAKRAKVLGRISSQEKIARAIDALRKNNIYVTCDTIFGFPDETEAELKDLIKFYNRHTPDHCENFWLRYYPRTGMTEWALNNGFISHERKEAIENGRENFGLFKSQGDTAAPHTPQIMLFLSFLPFIPVRWRKTALEKNSYKHMPVFSSMFVYILVRLFNHPKFDFNTERTIKRYLYFLNPILFFQKSFSPR